jgi:hypothetical protein
MATSSDDNRKGRDIFAAASATPRKHDIDRDVKPRAASPFSPSHRYRTRSGTKRSIVPDQALLYVVGPADSVCDEV